MFKKIRETLKMFKCVKGMVVLKCDNCESIDLRIVEGSLKYNDISGTTNYDLKNVQYDLRCNKCGTHGSVGENWFIEKVEA